MTNEKETVVSLEDAQNAAESLFGDAAAVPTAEVAKEEEAKGETAPDAQGSRVAEEGQAGEAETDVTEDLKVVVSVRDGRATIGVQQPSSDPHIECFDDLGLSGLAQGISDVLERAKARWEEAPKHPAYSRPAPSNRRRHRREQGSAQASTAEGESAQPQPEALRLF